MHMRGMKLFILLLGLVLLVSAGGESVDYRHDSRKLEERELRRGGGGGGRSSGGRSSGGRSYGSYDSSSYSGSTRGTFYHKAYYMGTVYYYNVDYNRTETCSDYLQNYYCMRKDDE